jgi:hypothetical protein
MNSIIDELFLGNLSTSELFQWTKEYQTLSENYSDTIDRLQKTLGRRQSKIFKTVIQQALDLSCYETQAYFRIGFCLGARFMLEVMQFEIP